MRHGRRARPGGSYLGGSTSILRRVDVEGQRLQGEPPWVDLERPRVEFKPSRVDLDLPRVDVERPRPDPEPPGLAGEPQTIEVEPPGLAGKPQTVEVELQAPEVEPSRLAAEPEGPELDCPEFEVKPWKLDLEPPRLDLEPQGNRSAALDHLDNAAADIAPRLAAVLTKAPPAPYVVGASAPPLSSREWMPTRIANAAAGRNRSRQAAAFRHFRAPY